MINTAVTSYQLPQVDPAAVEARITAALARLAASTVQLHPYERRYLANLLEGLVSTYSRPTSAVKR